MNTCITCGCSFIDTAQIRPKSELCIFCQCAQFEAENYRLRAELERVEKQVAEMKDTLMLVWGLTWESLSMSRADYMQILKRVEACKLIDFGQGYLSPAELRDSVKPLVEGLKAVDDLINESTGVSGLHLNGDPAPWGELRKGERFEEWLSAFDEALEHAKAKGWL